MEVKVKVKHRQNEIDKKRTIMIYLEKNRSCKAKLITIMLNRTVMKYQLNQIPKRKSII